MEKFSLYEILSFFIPGFILNFILQCYLQYVFSFPVFLNFERNIEENILLICFLIFTGIILHIFTFYLIKKIKWFKIVIMPSVQQISVQKENIQKIIPFLNEEYQKIKKHNENIENKNEAIHYLFDFAYYYLEVNDKITAAKNFQSLYFWFRNMFTISLILIPTSITIWIYTLCSNFSYSQQNNSLFIMLLNFICFIFIILSARWLRIKTIEKVLWGYYIERVHQF